jgi:hypothetical protein
MTKNTLLRSSLLFLCGALAGGVIVSRWKPATVAAAPQQDAAKPGPDLASMQAEIDHLKEVVPSQSHAMTDVGFQFANLWFAGQKKNWPLADFYLNEARQHIQWTIRIRPIRKDADGNPVNLKGLFAGIDNSAIADLRDAITKKDSAQFVVGYKETLAGCYGCHKASGKPYLKPQIPKVPPQPLMNFDPAATWPE